MWKLPMFEATTPEQIRAELEACAAAFPDHRVRLIGYERARQLAAMCLETHPGGR
jgi:ribulose-bisphosphate carboxylase small chain